MIPFFRRAAPVLDACDLGRSAVALPLHAGCAVPADCPVVIVDAVGRPRRATTPSGRKLELRPGELAWAFHPGPYTMTIVPYAQAPEIGLNTTFAIDPLDPAAAGKRFDLYLAAEADGRVDLAALAVAVEDAVRAALAQGALDLPPCTSIDEWNAFRLGLNQLLYLRFGLTVDDCVPVELDDVDYAAQLAARADRHADAVAAASPPASAAPVPRPDPARDDAKALRRLFLELPCLMCGLRLGALPSGQDQFRQQQALLQRLDRLSVEITTMPALALAAPGQPLPLDEQSRRMRHSLRAARALDEAWALLARLDGAADDQLAALYDEAERIVANLEAECAGRRVASLPREAA